MNMKSPSARKVWIEIVVLKIQRNIRLASPSARKVWIEIEKYAEAFKRVESPSTGKVWTKIKCNILDLKKVFCAKVY